MEKIKALVVGCGSIGKRHISNLKSLGLEVYAYDISKETREAIEKEFKIKTFDDYETALKFLSEKTDSINISIICTPTDKHVEVASKALDCDFHTFIEKPISNSIKGVSSLIKKAREKKLINLVGCNMRYHKPLKTVRDILKSKVLGEVYSIRSYFGHYLPYWRPNVDYRKTYSASLKRGGGIILESIHEIDYLMWLFGDIKEFKVISKKKSKLEIDSEDIASIIIEFESGVIGEIHLDYLQKCKHRGCEIVGSNGTLIWESFGKNPEIAFIKQYDDKIKKWNIREIKPDINQPYIDEMKHLINCILKKEESQNDFEQALKVLKLTLKLKSFTQE